MPTNVCSVCGHVNRIGNRFCTNCGKGLFKVIYSGPRLLQISKDEYICAEYKIQQKRSTIGRDIGNTFVVDDEQISKYHAVIIWENDKAYIEDLESKNGVFVNGKQIPEQERLLNGSLIKLGTTMFRFEIINEHGINTD